MSEKIYPQGIRCFNRKPTQASFVLGAMVINVKEFNDWVNGEGREYLSQYQGQDQIKLQVLQSERTGLYVQVDNWKPNQ